MSALDAVRAAIATEGPISFSRYMELCLYDPKVGFYASSGAGRRGHFITSPEVGPLFGTVVASALDQWWEVWGRPSAMTFVDAGAGPGTLARAILGARPACARALAYVAVEISPLQRSKHPDQVTSVAEMPRVDGPAVVFANELLDNLPFDILDFDPAHGWTELKVDWSGHALVERRAPIASPPPAAAGPTRVPVQHRAASWLRRALEVADRGRVVVVDYAVDAYPVDPERRWLRTYAEHEPGGSPLVDPGSKDITADVDISNLARVAEPTSRACQADWLRHHGIDRLVEEGRDHWRRHAGAPDLAALKMRSRIGEAEALLDRGGLGAFTVLEWVGAG